MKQLVYSLIIVVLLATLVFAQGKIVNDKLFSSSLGREITMEIYLPEGYDKTTEPSRLLIYLHAGGAAWFGLPLATTYKPVLDEAIKSGKIDPIVVVYPRVAFNTAYGVYIQNNWHQWVDSERNGKYESVVTIDLLEYMRTLYNAGKRREECAIGGFMMGGEGATRIAIRHSDKFIAAFSHVNLPSMPGFLIDSGGFFTESGGTPPFNYSLSNGNYSAGFIGSASAFSPNLVNPNMPNLFLDLPFDIQGRIIKPVWERWVNGFDAAALVKNPNIYKRDVAFYFQSIPQDKVYLDPFLADFESTGVPFTHEVIGSTWSPFPDAMHSALLVVDKAMDEAQMPVETPEHDLKLIKYADQITNFNLFANIAVSPRVWLKNVGASAETGMSVECVITQGGAVQYRQTVDVAALEPLAAVLLHFPEWRPTDKTPFETVFTAQAPADLDPLNNELVFTTNFSYLVDDFDHGCELWQLEGDWGLEATGEKNSKFCLTDRPYITYWGNSDTWASPNYSFDFTQLVDAEIEMVTKYGLQRTGNDRGVIEASVDDGATWTQVGEDFSGNNQTWHNESRSLKEFCGSGFGNVRLRFRLISDDDGRLGNGWFIDNLSISGMLTQVNAGSEQPTAFELFDNYPNPFNGGTTIAYMLPKEAQVSLTIYNSLGQEIAVPVDRKEQSGRHQIYWDGNDRNGLPTASGVYMYVLKAGELVMQKKMVVLK